MVPVDVVYRRWSRNKLPNKSSLFDDTDNKLIALGGMKVEKSGVLFSLGKYIDTATQTKKEEKDPFDIGLPWWSIQWQGNDAVTHQFRYMVVKLYNHAQYASPCQRQLQAFHHIFQKSFKICTKPNSYGWTGIKSDWKPFRHSAQCAI